MEIYGTDISKDSIELANKSYAGNKIFKGAYLPNELFQKIQSFDAILLIETIEHLDDTNLEKVFSDIKQLLKSDGILIITTPNNEDLKASDVYCPACDHIFHRYQHMRSWNPESLTTYLQDSRFIVESILETDFSFNHHSAKAQLKRFVKYLLGLPASRPHLMAIVTKT